MIQKHTFSLLFYIRRDKANKDGLAPAYVRITLDGKRAELSKTGDPIVSHDPFIADSSEDIMRFYSEYRQGEMKHISTVGESQRLSW
jgi:hypothetical protein